VTEILQINEAKMTAATEAKIVFLEEQWIPHFSWSEALF
jgi:hypothetical protein